MRSSHIARQPHILYIVPFRAEFSGADRDFIHIVNRLPERYRITIVSLSDGEALGAQLKTPAATRILTIPFALYPYMLVEHQEERVHPIRYLRFMRWLYRMNRRALRTLCEHLADERVDLVHTWVSTIPLGALFAQSRRTRHIWHARETLFANTYKQRIWLWIMHRYADVILAPTDSTARGYGPKAIGLGDGAPIDDVRARYNAVGTTSLAEAHGLENRFVICQTGVVHIHKGQLQLVEAIAQLRQRRPDVKIRVFLLGKQIDQAYARLVQAAISDNHLQDSVHLMGYRADYWAFVKLADLVVNPSPLPDSYPNAVRDAMMVGKAVVATASGGIPDMIVDGEDGILVPPGDVAALSRAIERLYDDPALRLALGNRAYSASETRFNIDNTVNRLDALYESLLSTSSDRRR